MWGRLECGLVYSGSCPQVLQSGMYPYCLQRAARTISSLWACRKTLKAGEAAAKSRREEVVMQAARASCEVEERAAKAKT